MSMNFHIRGQRDITVNKTGAVETQHCEYWPWQTPTDITRELLAAKLPVEAYKAYIMRIAWEVQEAVDAEEDNPIGYKTVNFAKDECDHIDEWVAAVVAQGYELEFYTI